MTFLKRTEPRYRKSKELMGTFLINLKMVALKDWTRRITTDHFSSQFAALHELVDNFERRHNIYF